MLGCGLRCPLTPAQNTGTAQTQARIPSFPPARLPAWPQDNWNKLDLFIVLVSIPDIVATFTSHNAATGIVTAMRLLRVCRMFKLIRGAKGLRTLFNTLISSLPAIGNVGSLLLLIM